PAQKPTRTGAATPRRLGQSDAAKPLAPVPAAIKENTTQRRLGLRLKKLKRESKLTWKTVAKESGVSYRWLFDISSGRTPSAETRRTIQDYFSRILKRPIRF